MLLSIKGLLYTAFNVFVSEGINQAGDTSTKQNSLSWRYLIVLTTRINYTSKALGMIV